MTCKIKTKVRHIIGIALVSLTIQFVVCSCEEAFTADKIPNGTGTPGPTARYKIPEPATWAFPDIIESACKITPRNIEGRLFNKYGLAYSREELESLPIETMSPKDLQKYADIVTHAYPDAVFRQIRVSCKEIPLEQMNETSIANIAYVSINAIDPSTRERAAICLREIQERLKEDRRSN